MEAKRSKYLDKLISKKHNGRIKIISGLRRSGKSYLLFELFYRHLRNVGIDDSHILKLALDESSNAKYRNPMELEKYVRENISNDEAMHYVFLDEIQFVRSIPNPWLPGTDEQIGFVDVLLGLMKIKNLDIYVTGCNSKMLSKNIVTQFRDRGNVIEVHPLSFVEFYEAFSGDKSKTWLEFRTYGGLPNILHLNSHEEKSEYLKNLFHSTYLKDVVERNYLHADVEKLSDLLNVVASSVGSLTNPSKLSNTFKSMKNQKVSSATLAKYLDFFEDTFILSKAHRFDVKGKKYLSSPLKYYFNDIGLRNALLNFRQQEEPHIMENILFNELKIRGYDVDVGIVEYNYKQESKSMRKQLEIDFVVNKSDKRVYIQSALTINDPKKMIQESESLKRVHDNFQKIIITKDETYPWHTDDGTLIINLQDFLLNSKRIL